MKLYTNPRENYSVFMLLFGIALQFAFAEGFLAIVRHFLQEDPEALAMYPKFRIGMYIFWAPFMIKNVLDYLKGWKAYNARKRLERQVDASKTAAAKASAKAIRNAAAAKAAKNEALKQERAIRAKENREWQRKVTEEQRKQNETATKFCTQCGRKIRAKAKFCPACGEKH